MRVLWLSHLVPYPPKGGVLQRSYYLLREVARYHEVYLLAFIQGALLRRGFASLDEGLEASHTKLSEFCRHVRFVQIACEQRWLGKERLLVESLFTVYPYGINWLKSHEMRRQIERLLEKVSFDVVHFDTISLAPYARFFSQCRKMLNHHNIESDMMLRRASLESSPLKRFYFYQEGYKLRAFERRACPRFNVNITCSKLDEERLLRNIPDLNVAVIPNGVDLAYFHPMNLRKEERSLIFAGGLSWYPNSDAMAFFAEQVWPLLRAAVPDVKMTVVGKDPPPCLIRLAATDHNFRVTGFVDDVRPYMDKAAVYVCPVRDGGGTKLKILDALAMCKPIVANPVACEGIDVVDGESVSFATRPEDYVGKILRLFNDEDLRHKLGQNGRKLIAEKYSFTNIGKELAEMYSRQ